MNDKQHIRLFTPRHTISTVLCAAALLSATACGSGTSAVEAATLATDGVVIITNSRANVPVPRLSTGNAELVAQALQQGLPVRVISADGTPSPVEISIPEVSGNNEHSRQASLEEALATVSMAITVLPDSDGANGYGAFAVARDSAVSLDLANPTIICLACGVDTEGPLDLTIPDALLAAPADYVDYLESSGQLAAFGDSFDSVQVILTSTGATAPPQEPLAPAHVEALTAIWREVLTAGGANVAVDPYPVSGDSVPTQYTVPTITPPALPGRTPTPSTAACEPQRFSFDGASGARFQPETDQWVSESEARDALSPLAEWLREQTNRTASIQGTTAGVGSGRADEGIELSLHRARAAAELLIELGASAEQIVSIEGLGPDYPGRVTDRDTQGNPIPSERTKNRKVIVILQESCD